MKKSILNLGKALDKAQQKQILGGTGILPEVPNEMCDVPEGSKPEGCMCYSSDECSGQCVDIYDLYNEPGSGSYGFCN